ncbi:hypothetical protein [Trinickia mobilis]|uniref:hypothetical protein n=1 Tax=Trinickia mobilis TaxID=2816356 RepID=UPI001A8F917E|nr:hypothetical protein [Trinickia mobilis]
MSMLSCFFVQADAMAECNEQQEAGADLPIAGRGSVHAIACSTSDGIGTIEIDVVRREKTKATLQTTYESPAYVLTLDTTIAFDAGASQGVGVSTGRGRDGTGMHYWKIPTTGESIVDLGDAPSLQPDKFMRGVFSTLVSSAGQYQSIRYFYEVKGDRLVPTKAVGFYAKSPQTFVATLMDLLPSGEAVPTRQRTLSVENANRCMNGKISCW